MLSTVNMFCDQTYQASHFTRKLSLMRLLNAKCFNEKLGKNTEVGGFNNF